MKPPLVRAVYQDNCMVALEWDPPAVPGEKVNPIHGIICWPMLDILKLYTVIYKYTYYTSIVLWENVNAPTICQKYELHWAGSVKDEFCTEELSEFGSLPTGVRTEFQTVWPKLDPTTKLTTFWFGVKTFTNSCEIPPTEFVKVVRKKCPGIVIMHTQYTRVCVTHNIHVSRTTPKYFSRGGTCEAPGQGAH